MTEISPVPFGLTVETIQEPRALWTDRPRFGWSSNGRQTGYELEIADADAADGAPIATTGIVESAASVLVEVPGFVAASRTPYRWRVRVWTATGGPSAWAESSFETSILDPGDWLASWVEPVQEPVTPETAGVDPVTAPVDVAPPEERLHPAPIVRQTFDLDDVPSRARLYITAHGVFEVHVNGERVSDDVLSPGYDAHPVRLSFVAHDVTRFLRPGRNVVAVVLGDGWWSGRTSMTGLSANYGDRLGVLWQLEADGEPVATSGRPAVSSFGGIRYSDIFIGEKFDARAVERGWNTVDFDDSGWSPAIVIGGSVAGLVPFVGEPVRRILEIADPAIITTPEGETVIDLGQNIAGRVRLSAEGPAGTTIVLEHTESLDRDGNFQNNILGLNKDQTDVWVLAGTGRETFEPTFTFHGFRYVRVTGYPGTLQPRDVTGVVISSALTETGAFETDDPRINRLHENVVWSQRGNFLSIPTDCPQRERAGWTGDIQIFAASATNIANVDPFLTRWLANVRAAQFADGQIPMIVPNTPSFQRMLSPHFTADSSAGWGDAITIVPLVLYERYGDRRALEDNYDAMRRWVDYCRRQAESGVPERFHGVELDEATRERQSLLWNTGFHFGDWLAPSTLDPDDIVSTLDVARLLTAETVAAAFSAKSVENLATVAAILGDEETAAEMSSRHARIVSAFAEEYVDEDGRITPHMQGTYVLALTFGLIPADLRARAAAHLVDLIEQAGDHLDTGFLSIPYLLDVLVDVGRPDLAYRVLLQDTAPSWLYQVDLGATTIWEIWRAVASDGQPGPMSLNHYAFGCLDDWLYRHVAGIQLVEPAYRSVVIQPDVTAPFDRVAAGIDTPYGRIEAGYERRDDETVVRVRVPAGVDAELRLPGAEPRRLAPGSHEIVAS